MKRILLASTAIVAFAGAAAAEGHTGISFSGSAELGYNDDAIGDNDGFYSDLDIVAGFAAELDNGLMVGASLDLDNLVDLANSDDGTNNGIDYELSLTSETAGLYYGDTNFAAQNVWVGAGDMESDGFSEADGEEALRGEATFGGVSAQLSYVLANDAGIRVAAAGNDSDLDQLSVGLSADFGNVNAVLAYQEASGVTAGSYATNGDFNEGEVLGLSIGTSVAGADLRLAYAEDDDSDSIGIQAAYPLGPVTATVYYVAESVGDDNYGLTLAYENGPVAVTLDYDNDQGVNIIGVEGSYDVGNGLTMYAGFITDDGDDTDAYYIAGTYDLGSGAELLVSFADDDDATNDEVGAGDYQQGTTVEVSFDF